MAEIRNIENWMQEEIIYFGEVTVIKEIFKKNLLDSFNKAFTTEQIASIDNDDSFQQMMRSINENMNLSEAEIIYLTENWIKNKAENCQLPLENLSNQENTEDDHLERLQVFIGSVITVVRAQYGLAEGLEAENGFKEKLRKQYSLDMGYTEDRRVEECAQ